MIVTSTMQINLQKREMTPCVDTVQDDQLSRQLQIQLYAGQTPWQIPEGTSAIIRYRKSDGTGGAYDTLPDGSTACQFQDNILTVLLAPQVCTTPGYVSMDVWLVSGEKTLSVFPVSVRVWEKVGAQEMESSDYYHIVGYLPQPAGAEAGQYLRITQVDEQGKILAMEAVDGAWESLKNKPFYDESLYSEHAFSTVPQACFQALGYYFFKVSDLVLNKAQLLKTVISTVFGTAIYEQTPVESEILLETVDVLGFQFTGGSHGMFVMAYKAGDLSVDFAGQTVSMRIPEAGIYMAFASDSPDASITVTVSYTDIVTLDHKFVPPVWNDDVLLQERRLSFMRSESGLYAYAGELFDLTAGEVYRVFWDGEEYVCTAAEGESGLYLGDLGILQDAESFTEPFLVQIVGGTTVVGTREAGISHRLAVHRIKGESLQLPAVTGEDEGKFLRVVDGRWAAASIDSAEEASF